MDSLQRLRSENPDVAQMLDAFGEIDNAYSEALEAIGGAKKPRLTFSSSAEFTVSFHSSDVSKAS